MRNFVSFSILFHFLANASDQTCPMDGCPTPHIDRDLLKYGQEDSELAKHIKQNLLISPPIDGRQLNLNITDVPRAAFPNLRAQYGQPIAIQDIFYGQDRPLVEDVLESKYFIEAGAYDGVYLSNSLFLEMKHKWSGLLVEPNPDYFKVMESRGRNAWLYPGCFSTKDKSEIVRFDAAGLVGGIENTADPSKPKPGEGMNDWVNRRTIEAQCLPLYSLINALDNPRIDYMSLDIEGSELQVLQTIPWDKMDISVLGVEINHLGEVFPGKLEDLREFLFNLGYKLYQKVSIDEIYVKRSLLKKQNIKDI